MIPSSVHTPETLQLLRDTLDDAWAALRPHERAHEQDQAGDAPNQMAAAC
jgi:hypothetical protein